MAETGLQLNHVGLDPVSTSSVKLHAKHILELKEFDQSKGLFTYSGHRVQNVDLTGRVVKIRRSHKFTKYHVDDGTGVVSVVCWHNDDSSLASRTDMREGLGPSLRRKLDALLEEQESILEPYALGDLLHVQGKLKNTYGSLEVSANFHEKLSNPMHEVLRLAEMPKIYRDIYRQPVRLPPLVEQQLLGGTTAVGLSQAKVVTQLEELILQSMERCQGDTSFETEELLSIAENVFEKECISDSEARHELLTNTVFALLKKGYIFSTNKQSSVFKLVAKCASLKQAVLLILREDAEKNTNTDSYGCHSSAVFRLLRSRVDFAHVSKEAVVKCLALLEGESDVISTADNYYIVFGG